MSLRRVSANLAVRKSQHEHIPMHSWAARRSRTTETLTHLRNSKMVMFGVSFYVILVS